MGWKLFSAPSQRTAVESGRHAAASTDVPDAHYEVVSNPARQNVMAVWFGMDITPKRLLNGLLTVVALVVGTVMIFTYSAPVEAQAVEPAAVPVVMVAEEVTPEPTPVPMDDVLALAMGIDAVVSSVPGAENCTDTTLLMIGTVIMNRTQDARYPGTVFEVLTQPQQFSCFSESGLKWVGVSSYRTSFKERCTLAAERVIAGERVFDNSVVYVSSSRQGTLVAQLDGLYFGR